MTVWVLLVILYTHSAAPVAEYPSQAACENAAKVAAKSRNIDVRFGCFELVKP